MNLAHPKEIVQTSVSLWPSSKLESWKFNKIDHFYSQKFQLAQEPDFEELADYAESAQSSICSSVNCVHLFFLNGFFDSDFNLPALARLNQLGVEIIESNSSKAEDSSERMQFVNSIVNSKIINIKFSKRASKELILQLMYLGDKVGQSATFPNLNIVCEPHSQAQIIETQVSRTARADWRNANVTADVQSNASLVYVIDQDIDYQSFIFHSLQSTVADDAKLDVLTLSRGANLARHDLGAELGRLSTANFYGLNLVRGSQKSYHNTKVRHLRSEGVSEQLYKSVLNEKSQVAFVGTIRIEENAQKVSSKQYNKSLLMSSDAEVDSKPSLEIFADDVKANHGATVGQLDEAQVFYFQSRGVSKEKALSLVASGFCLDVVSKISNAELRAHVSKLVERTIRSDN